MKALLLLPGNQFSFYEERQWIALDHSATRTIVQAATAGAPEARYGFQGKNRLLDLGHLIQREAGSNVGHVMRVVRNDGLEMMRGNPTGPILINPAAEAAVTPAAPAPAPAASSGAGGGSGSGGSGSVLTQTQKDLLAHPGNHWFYAEGGQWKPIPPQIYRAFGPAITANAPGVAFDWGTYRFGLDFRTFVMTNTSNGVGHLVLAAKPDRAEIMRGNVAGAVWKIGGAPAEPAAARASVTAGGSEAAHMTRSYSGRVLDAASTGLVAQTSGLSSQGSGETSAATTSAYIASVGLSLKPVRRFFLQTIDCVMVFTPLCCGVVNRRCCRQGLQQRLSQALGTQRCLCGMA